jgi:hypothetical protein
MAYEICDAFNVTIVWKGRILYICVYLNDLFSYETMNVHWQCVICWRKYVVRVHHMCNKCVPLHLMIIWWWRKMVRYWKFTIFIHLFFVAGQTKISERVYDGCQLDKITYNKHDAQHWQFIDKYLAVVTQLSRFALMSGNCCLHLHLLNCYLGMTDARTRTLIYSSIESMLQLCCKNVPVNGNCTIIDNQNMDNCIVGG